MGTMRNRSKHRKHRQRGGNQLQIGGFLEDLTNWGTNMWNKTKSYVTGTPQPQAYSSYPFPGQTQAQAPAQYQTQYQAPAQAPAQAQYQAPTVPRQAYMGGRTKRCKRGHKGTSKHRRHHKRRG